MVETGAKTLEEAVSVVGVAEPGFKPAAAEEEKIKVGIKEDLEDIKQRIKLFLSRAIVTGLNTPARSIIEGIIKRTGLFDEKWIHYTNIQVQNNMFKEAFKKVPKSERVVFIPHCLRNVKNCKAPVDEDGYHCMKCGSCVIGKIVEECEKRGMKWYMCGGGTQVINIISRTKPKAIIGIACYNEIMLALEKLKTSGVPLQAVMLRKSGCVNTEVDITEVIEILDQ